MLLKISTSRDEQVQVHRRQPESLIRRAMSTPDAITTDRQLASKPNMANIVSNRA